jgi:hypothetical protein
VAKVSITEIAEKVRRPGEDPEAVMSKLLNWVKMDLILPLGDKHVGKGKRRFYGEHSVVDALVLNALTYWGIPATQVATMLCTVKGETKERPLLRLARDHFKTFEEQERAGVWLWLSVHRDQTRDMPPTAILHRTANVYIPSESRKVADLVRTFEHVQIPHWSQSSIVLSLTELFKQLRKQG